MDSKITLSDRYIPEKLARKHRLSLVPTKLYLYRICKVKILVVTDAGGGFGAAGFDLSAFLKAFDEPLSYTTFEITKAHRRSDSDADIENFRFNTHNLDQYDVIFLFGVERTRSFIPNTELRAISEYMDNGGGIFATGDHEDLGVDLCGKIPRIRSMRRWFTASNPGPNGEPHAPDQVGPNRHDTIVDTNSGAPGIQGSQSDMVPQTISPVYRYGFVYPGSLPHSLLQYVKYPHPVLCSPDGEIDYLPDHMHEGLCEVPSNLTMSFNFNGYTIQEYPVVGSSRLRPQVIAHARNSVTNSNFGVIAALDGHQHSNIGRVLVDATWHHFFNININQWQNLKEAVDGGYTPTAAEVTALQKYNLIQHYYRNIAYWLARRDKQSCFRIRGLRWLMGHLTVKMSLKLTLKGLSKFDRFSYYHTLGVLAKDALGDLQSVCQSSAFYLVLEYLGPVLKTKPPFPKPDTFSFINPEIFEAVSLGASLHELNVANRETKGDLSENDIERILKKSSIESVDEMMDLVRASISRYKRNIKKRR